VNKFILEEAMFDQDIWKHVIVCLLFWLGLGSGTPLLTIQKEIVVLERKMLDENFRLYSLDVDHAGAFYFGSFEEIVKLQPDGRRVFEFSAGDYGMKRIADFRVAANGDLVVAGQAADRQASFVKARVLVFGTEGRLLQSFEVPRLAVETVETGEDGEIFLAGLKQADHPSSSSVRAVVYRFSAKGEVLALFEEGEVKATGRIISKSYRRLAVTGRDLFLLDPTSPDLLLRRFSPQGQKLEERRFSLASPEGPSRSASGKGEPFAAKLDYFSSLNSDLFILAESAVSDRWQQSTVGKGKKQALALYRPFSYAVYLVSLDGTVLHPIVTQNLGLLRAVGRDGFLYFVRNITMGGKARTEVTKATLR